MPNRFGLKDLVLLVVLLAVGLSVWLSMVQQDRQWRRMDEVSRQLTEVERSLGRLREAVAGGGAGGGGERGGGGGGGGASGPTIAGEGAAGRGRERDESWARPGVAVEWLEPWGPASDPKGMPGYTPGGELREAFEAQTARIVPFMDQDVYSRRITDMVCQSLGAYDPRTLRLRGVLAAAWQMDPGGMWFRVKIHDAAVFSDGRPVTAEDVRWTYHEFVMNQSLRTESAKGIFDVIDTVEVVEGGGGKAVEFRFDKPFFSNQFQAAVMYVLPKHYYEGFTADQLNKATGLLMGSGPYRLSSLPPEPEWASPREVVLVRNEAFWGVRPSLDKLRYTAIKDDLARLTAYRNGECDMTTPVAPQFARVPKEDGWDTEDRALSWLNMRSMYGGIAWQCGPRGGKLRPFADKRVRRAMTQLLDREKMIREIWEGIGEVAMQAANSKSVLYDPGIKPWPYDLAAARALLEEAGWKDRGGGDGILRNEAGEEFKFEFTYSTGGEIAERIARYIQSQCALAGIRCIPNGIEWSVYSQVMARRDFDALFIAWGASDPEGDPTQIWHSKSIENQGNNFGQWNCPEADRLIDAARAELDREKRAALWRQFQRVQHEEQPYTWVRMSPWLRFVKKRFDNVRTYPKGLEQGEWFIPPSGGGLTPARPG